MTQQTQEPAGRRTSPSLGNQSNKIFNVFPPIFPSTYMTSLPENDTVLRPAEFFRIPACVASSVEWTHSRFHNAVHGRIYSMNITLVVGPQIASFLLRCYGSCYCGTARAGEAEQVIRPAAFSRRDGWRSSDLCRVTQEQRNPSLHLAGSTRIIT